MYKKKFKKSKNNLISTLFLFLGKKDLGSERAESRIRNPDRDPDLH